MTILYGLSRGFQIANQGMLFAVASCYFPSKADQRSGTESEQRQGHVVSLSGYLSHLHSCSGSRGRCGGLGVWLVLDSVILAEGKSPVGSRMCMLQPSHIGQWMERRRPPPENSEVGVVRGVFIFASRYDCHVGSYSLEFVLLVWCIMRCSI